LVVWLLLCKTFDLAGSATDVLWTMSATVPWRARQLSE
jgi:hypothetical protein